MADLRPVWITAPIGAAAAKTAGLDLRDFYVIEVQTDSGYDGTSMTFETGARDTNDGFIQRKDRFGTAYTVTISASGHADVPLYDMLGGCYLKCVSSATEAAATVITLKLVRA